MYSSTGVVGCSVGPSYSIGSWQQRSTICIGQSSLRFAQINQPKSASKTNACITCAKRGGVGGAAPPVGESGESGDCASGSSGTRPSRASAVRLQIFPSFWWICPEIHCRSCLSECLSTGGCKEHRRFYGCRGRLQNHCDIPAAFISFWRRTRN